MFGTFLKSEPRILEGYWLDQRRGFLFDEEG